MKNLESLEKFGDLNTPHITITSHLLDTYSNHKLSIHDGTNCYCCYSVHVSHDLFYIGKICYWTLLKGGFCTDHLKSLSLLEDNTIRVCLIGEKIWVLAL